MAKIMIQMLTSIGMIIWGISIYASGNENYRTYMLIVGGALWLIADIAQLTNYIKKKRKSEPERVKSSRKTKKRTMIIILCVIVVLAGSITLLMMAYNHAGPFAVYSEPFTLTRTDGQPIMQNDFKLFKQALEQRLTARYGKDAGRAGRLLLNDNGEILFSANEYVIHSVRLDFLANEFMAFFTQGILEVKTGSGDVVIENEDIEDVSSEAGHYMILNLAESGKSKLATAMHSASPLVLQVYYDGRLINTQSLYFSDDLKSTPRRIHIRFTDAGSGNGRFVPLQLKYTIISPLPFDVTLHGREPVDLTCYLEHEDSWAVGTNGKLSFKTKD